MKNLILVLTLCISTLSLSSFIAPETAKEMPGATIFEMPYSTSGFLCNGEFLELEGTWKIVTNLVFAADGSIHLTENWSIKASGIGSFGNEYKLNYSDNFHVNQAFFGFPFNVTNAFNFNIIGKGSAPNLKQQAVIHTTVNANGEITADFEKGQFTCK